MFSQVATRPLAFVRAAGTHGLEEAIETEHLFHGGDGGRDELQPALGFRRVRYFQKEQRLVILIETGQDVALNVADIENLLSRGAR